MKKLVSILLTCTLLMLSTAAFAMDTEIAGGFYDVGSFGDVTTTFFEDETEATIFNIDIDNDEEEEMWHPKSNRIEIVYTNAVCNVEYIAILVLGTGVPTKDDEIIFIDQITAESSTINFNVYPTLPEMASEMTLYISSSLPDFELINIPLKYAVDVEYLPYTLGDINNDGVFDVKDALIVLKIGVDKIEATAAERAAADVNGDGACDVKDALLILKYGTGKIDSFK